MILSILLILKHYLFMNITNVTHNRFSILILSGLISLFLFTIISFSNNKRKRTLGLILYSIISIIMFADIMYFSFFNILPSVVMLKHMWQVAAVGDSLVDLLSFKNLLFILDIPILIIGYLQLKKIINIEDRPYNKYVQWGVPLAIGLILVTFSFNLYKQELIGPVSNQEIYTYHAKDIKKPCLKLTS